MGWLEHLRKKPLKIKKMIAFSISAGVTLVLLVFWFATYRYTLSPSSNGQTATSTPNVFSSLIQLFTSSFKQSVSEQPSTTTTVEQNGISNSIDTTSASTQQAQPSEPSIHFSDESQTPVSSSSKTQ